MRLLSVGFGYADMQFRISSRRPLRFRSTLSFPLASPAFSLGDGQEGCALKRSCNGYHVPVIPTLSLPLASPAFSLRDGQEGRILQGSCNGYHVPVTPWEFPPFEASRGSAPCRRQIDSLENSEGHASMRSTAWYAAESGCGRESRGSTRIGKFCNSYHVAAMPRPGAGNGQAARHQRIKNRLALSGLPKAHMPDINYIVGKGGSLDAWSI